MTKFVPGSMIALLEVKNEVGRIAMTAIAQIMPIAPQIVRCWKREREG